MLYCNINPQAINPLCGLCKKCSGRSRCDYPFEKNLLNSDDLVAAIIDFVNANTGYACERTQVHKKPDINVFAPNGEIICRIEAKYLEGQAFMKSQQYIGLHPRETLVVDEPKLLSYFECKQNDRAQGKDIPIFVVWKFDRYCDDIGGITVFQEIDTLWHIYNECGEGRFLQRRAATNDFQNGRQLGITRKYHYSIRECAPIENLPHWILSL